MIGHYTIRAWLPWYSWEPFTSIICHLSQFSSTGGCRRIIVRTPHQSRPSHDRFVRPCARFELASRGEAELSVRIVPLPHLRLSKVSGEQSGFTRTLAPSQMHPQGAEAQAPCINLNIRTRTLQVTVRVLTGLVSCDLRSFEVEELASLDSPARIRTEVLGSKDPDDWPLHHRTRRVV